MYTAQIGKMTGVGCAGGSRTRTICTALFPIIRFVPCTDKSALPCVVDDPAQKPRGHNTNHILSNLCLLPILLVVILIYT